MSFYHWNSCLSVDNLQFSPFLCLIFFRCEMKLSELEKSNSIIDVFKKKRPRLSPLFGAILQIRWLIIPCSHIIWVVRDLLYTTWSMLNEKLALAKLKNKKTDLQLFTMPRFLLVYLLYFTRVSWCPSFIHTQLKCIRVC